MTANRKFKQLVRERMARTGERYAAARAQVLATGTSDADDRDTRSSAVLAGHELFPDVQAVGGQQPDVAAARNLCANAGVVGPDDEPLSEAAVFGLCGGVGFLYGVFVYDEGPTMTIVARNESMPDPFLEPLFARVGAAVQVATTGGAKKAAATLDATLAAGTPALATVGAGALGYLGQSEAMASMAPHVVGVVGVGPGGEVLVDDRAPVPIPVDRATFDTARGAYAKAKHRLITVTATDTEHDWARAVAEAVVDGAEGFDRPPVPQFAANVGRAGLTKFHRLLTHERDAKGWARVFGQGPAAALGFGRLIDCIDHDYTAPAAGRPLQAEFLRWAAALVSDAGPASPAMRVAGEGAPERWAEAGDEFARSGEAWARIVALAADAHPDLARYAELVSERAEGLDAEPDPGRQASLAAAQQEAIAGCDLADHEAGAVRAAIAAEVAVIIEAEERALALTRVD